MTIPALSEVAFWEKFTSPLFRFLEVWRVWDEILLWQKEHGHQEDLVRNGVVYLNMKQRIKHDKQYKMWGDSLLRSPLEGSKKLALERVKKKKAELKARAAALRAAKTQESPPP